MAEHGAPDQRERDAALDTRRSFIVQAPAGSGKTELLVQRYLRLLEIVAKPEEIVAITFTRKAAAEMRKRVMEKLAPELAPRLRILTIDALCAALTRQMPVLARFGAQPAVAEDASEFYREAAARTLAELTPAVARLLAHLDNNVSEAASLLAGMLERRDQWLRRTGHAPTRAELEATLAAERERLIRHARSLYAGADAELAQALLTQKGEWRKRPPPPPELVGIAGLREALVALRAAPPPSYSQAQWEALEAILALLNPAIAQLLALFGERGEVDFTQIAHGALQALGTPDEPTDLLLSMDTRVRHLLVDEFQDTSNSQWELLERLTAGWEAGDGRTVFVVGDPMQSIYRFRDAQVGLFLQARREGLPGLRLEPLTLCANFRSQARIVDWVNRSFPRILPAAEDDASGAVPYSPSAPLREPAPDGEPTLETCASRDDEARRVVELARAAQGKAAILVRNRSHLDAIVPALREAGIRFRAVEIEALGEKQVVQDLFALTRALTHLGDRVAWLAVLRAPWCGLTLEALSGFFEARNQATIWELMQEHPRFAALRKVLAPALENRLRGTLRDRVEGVWLALGGPACVADATDLEDAEIFLDQLEKLEVAGDLPDFASLAESLRKLYALPDVNAGEGAVEIMTIHKAKGLEFDTVIVPGLDRAPRSGRRPLFAWRALPGDRLLLAPIDETGGEKEPLFRYVTDLDREAEDIEAGRLLYVAATRAKTRLHLLACVKADEQGQVARPSRRSLLGIAWPALAGHVAMPARAAEPLRATPPPGDELRRLPADFRVCEPPASAGWLDGARAIEVSGQIEFSWAGESARHVGSVVHRWLQRVAEDELEGWDRARVSAMHAVFRAELGMRGIPEAELDDAARRVATALATCLEDERGRWLLGPQHQAQNEFRITALIDGELRNLVVDRTFVDAQGRRRIIDYKTSSHEGAGADEFLDRERERYRAQLDRYAVALAAEDALLGLYFPLLAGWREWQHKG
jgi:ATP-dependent exoDNAse (exonuclease V) beta subunit